MEYCIIKCTGIYRIAESNIDNFFPGDRLIEKGMTREAAEQRVCILKKSLHLFSYVFHSAENLNPSGPENHVVHILKQGDGQYYRYTPRFGLMSEISLDHATEVVRIYHPLITNKMKERCPELCAAVV